MKIAIVIWDLNIKGGTQRQALELAYQLKQDGNQVDVFCYLYDKKNCYKKLCNELNIISVKKGSTPTKQSFKDLFLEKQIKQLRSKIIEQKYDVINLHDYQVYKLAKYLKHKNIVWMMNDIVGTGAHKKNPHPNNLKERIILYVAKKQIKNIHKIVVLDNRNKQMCLDNYKIQAFVVRSGLDQSIFDKQKIAKNNKQIEIFASGIFFPHRRFEDIVDSIALLSPDDQKKVHVTINGSNTRDYSYYLYIKNLIDKAKLSKTITLINGLSEQNLLIQYLKSHIFIFPNHQQTWGLSVFEAMLAKCTCIVSRTSGAHEVLTDKKNAFLVNPKSPQEIADKINHLINNEELLKKISINGYDFVKQNISWEKYTDNMLKIFSNEK